MGFFPRGLGARRASLPAVLVVVGLLVSALAVLDPARPYGRILGPILAGAGLVAAHRLGSWRRLLPHAALAAVFALAAWTRPVFRADSWGYYEYLRSVTFDRDLDFANEEATWGLIPHALTATGHRRNVYPVGPAILWSPFYLAAHLYVLTDDALLGGQYSRDGYSAPYRNAPVLGTLVVAVTGATLLLRMLSDRLGAGAATVAVLGAVLASPILGYLFLIPSMAHGLVFGLAAALLWAWERARRAPSLATWTTLGGVFGLLTLTRWQALLYALLVLPAAIDGLARRTVRPAWLVAAGALALLIFAPQFVAWKILYGRYVTVPQGEGFLDWSSPHFLDTLISADHGLFSWTPVMLLGVAGLLWGLRAAPLLHAGSLLILTATAWVNGSAADWAGADAFGARRFDLVVPILAVGLGVVIERTLPALQRMPLLAPAGLLLVAGLWNAGLLALYREGKYPRAAPLERVAADQGRRLRLLAQEALSRLAGARGRALAYKFFSGEYYYSNYNEGGMLNLATLPKADLSGAWSPVRRKRGEPPFRWALSPEACVRIPLEAPFDLRGILTARAPSEGQVLSVVLNGEPITTVSLEAQWRQVALLLPAGRMVPGENFLCFRSPHPAPGEPGGGIVAAIATIELP